MFIAHTPKIIFIHIQRTGGTTITQLLRHSCRNYEIVEEQHSNIKSLPTNFFEYYNNYQLFTFVRNPWARLRSWFALFQRWNPQNEIDERMAFEQFLMSDDIKEFPTFHFNQLDYITNDKNEIVTDYIGRFENFEDNIQRIFQSLDIQLNQDIPVINQGSTQPYQQLYTERSRDFVYEKCRKDIDYFGYEF